MPNLSRQWTFINRATGAYVLIKVDGATPVNVPNSTTTIIICDGNGFINRKDYRNVGEIFYHGGTTPPEGSIECDATAYKRASLVDLFARIGTTFGSTDSTNFKVPPGTDTGRYLRSRTSGLTVGTTQSSQNKSHTHSGSGTTAGRSAGHVHSGSGTTGTQNADHAHSGAITGSTPSTSGGGSFTVVGTLVSGLTNPNNANHGHAFSVTTGGESADHAHAFSVTTGTGSADGSEARPESLVALMCIRY